MEEIADNQLLNQKKIIWRSVEDEEKIEKEWWNKICTFNLQTKQLTKKLRQDLIDNGIKPLKSENDLYLINSKMAEAERDKFDCFDRYNRVYLSQCYVFLL